MRGGIGVELVIVLRGVDVVVVGEDGTGEEEGVDVEGGDSEGVWSARCAASSIPSVC